jgi:hypothetical protein
MQADLEPTVQVRDLKRDRVNFILDNVDISCATLPRFDERTDCEHVFLDLPIHFDVL